MKTVLAPNAPWPYNKPAAKKLRSVPANTDKKFALWAGAQRLDCEKVFGKKPTGGQHDRRG